MNNDETDSEAVREYFHSSNRWPMFRDCCLLNALQRFLCKQRMDENGERERKRAKRSTLNSKNALLFTLSVIKCD